MFEWHHKAFFAPACGILVAGIVLIATIWLDRENISKFQAGQRAEILEQIRITGSRLVANILARQNIVTGISAFVRTGDSLTQQRFIEAANILVAKQSGIDGVILAPNGVVSFVSNYETMWPYIGRRVYDLVNRETASDPVPAIATGTIELTRLNDVSRPQIVNLVPIFLGTGHQSQDSQEFWGYAAIMIDAGHIFAISGLRENKSDRLRYTLRNVDGTVLYQDSRPASADTVLYSVDLPGASWTLAASPPNDIGTAWPGRNLLWTFGIFLSLTLGWLTWNLLVQPVRLQRRVEAATEELRESEDRYRNLVELSEVGISIIQRGEIRYANASFARYHEIDSPEMIEGNPYTDFFHTDDRAAISERMNRVLETGEASKPEEFRFLTADGKQIPVEETGSRIIVNRQPALLSVCHDLSHQKAIQEALVATEQREQQALRRETQMRSEMERQAFVQEKIQALGTVAGGIAHSLNNLLAPIIGLTKLTLDDLPKEDPKHENLSHVLAAADDAKDIVGEILAFSRQEEEEEMVTMSVSDALERARPLVEAAVPRSIGVDLDISNDVGMARLNASQITNLVLNLVSNAVDAMSGETGRLGVTLSRMDLEATRAAGAGLQEGSYIAISVSDTGPGIPTEVKHRLFDPFFTTKPVGEGTGLGLWIVHQIVQRHEGGILVDSEVGTGTTVTVLMKPS